VPAAAGEKKDGSSSVQVTIPDVAIRKIVSNIDISKKLRIDEKDAGEVRELDQVIDEEKAGKRMMTRVTRMSPSSLLSRIVRLR
jgi:hypothetical protein